MRNSIILLSFLFTHTLYCTADTCLLHLFILLAFVYFVSISLCAGLDELKKVQDSYSSSIAACLLQKKEVKMKKIVVGRLGGHRGVTHHCVISAWLPRLQTND